MVRLPFCDYHMHTKYLKCANETMVVQDIINTCTGLGVTSIGITDHLNTPEQLPLHKPIRDDIDNAETNIDIFFGVELNFMGCDGDFALTAAMKEELDFQFAIGGIHATYLEAYDLQKLLTIQHRHHLKTCADPLIDVLVHPYWFSKVSFTRNEWPLFDSMKVVPEKFIRELGQTAKATGTAIEINGGANLLNAGHGPAYAEEYIDFLAILAEEGVMFALGSDAHTITHLADVMAARDAAMRIGLTPDRIWHPGGTPRRKGKA